MKGNVEVLVGFEPDRIFLQKVPMDSIQTRTVRLVGKAIDKIEIKGLKSSDPEKINAVLIKEDGQLAVKVTLKAGKKEGRISGSVTAQTNLDKPSQITLFVWADVVGDIMPDRQYVMFAPYDQKHNPKAFVEFHSLSGRNFSINKVRDMFGFVKGKAKKQGKNWQVELTLFKKPDKWNGKVEVLTNRKDQPVIELSYSVQRSPRKPTIR